MIYNKFILIVLTMFAWLLVEFYSMICVWQNLRTCILFPLHYVVQKIYTCKTNPLTFNTIKMIALLTYKIDTYKREGKWYPIAIWCQLLSIRFMDLLLCFIFFGNMFEIFLEEYPQTIATTLFSEGLELPLYKKVHYSNLLIYFDFEETFKI